jgi:methionyl-tRNA formyltransferase
MAVPQQGEPTFAPKLTIDDARLDWTQPVAAVDARFRGVTPEPGAFTTIDGTRFKVLRAVPARGAAPLQAGSLAAEGRSVLIGTGSTPLELLAVQPAGKKPMPAIDWWRGRTAKAAAVAE